MKTAIVAVSGGVDSVMLLDMLVKKANMRLIVAHFDHGIREDSADDARFVQDLAKKYGLESESRREELGANVSEAMARERRYVFLRDLARLYGTTTIITAHHGDDVIETMAINLSRGTGWRGIAVLDSDIVRPLLGVTKKDILAYATMNNLEWREDSSNGDQRYLRNRIRARIRDDMDTDTKRQLWALWRTQCNSKDQIDTEMIPFLRNDATYKRYFLTYTDDVVAMEVLRACIVHKTGQSPTRPRVQRALLAIKTAKPGNTYEVGNGVKLLFTRTTFIVETL